jgi:hypothetical protein
MASFALEGGELLGRQGIEEGVRHLELSAVCAEPALARGVLDGGQSRNRRLAPQDGDLLTCCGALDQTREVRLGDMDSDVGHEDKLNLVN